LLHKVQPAFFTRKPLNRRDGSVCYSRDRHHAGSSRAAADMHGARATKSATTAKLRTGQLQVVTKNPQQWRVLVAIKPYFL
jgi:hypothetical protein